MQTRFEESKKMNAYTVEFTTHGGGEVHRISFLAENKQDAWCRAVFEEIPKLTGEQPYSAWVASVTYNNGNYRAFNTFEGKPY